MFNQFKSISGDTSDIRFRDPNTLKYWFRSIDTMCNFEYRVVLVVASPSQVPDWLNLQRVKIVFHNEFIPVSELPTFNSSVITCYLPYISTLNNKYIIFNDDMFMVNRVTDNIFFDKMKPVLKVCTQRFESGRGMWFDKIRLCQDIVNQWLRTTFYIVPEHGPIPHLKTMDLFIWDKLKSRITRALVNSKFRRYGNVSDWLFPMGYVGLGHWTPAAHQICEYFNTENITGNIMAPCACYNDTELVSDYDGYRNKLNDILEHKFPNKSRFEL